MLVRDLYLCFEDYREYAQLKDIRGKGKITNTR